VYHYLKEVNFALLDLLLEDFYVGLHQPSVNLRSQSQSVFGPQVQAQFSTRTNWASS